jgi:hypothetical protein
MPLTCPLGAILAQDGERRDDGIHAQEEAQEREKILSQTY